MPVALREQLRDVAAERDVSANLLVIRAVSDFLSHLPPVDDLNASRPDAGTRGPAAAAS